jgi:acyl-CoA synthetase (AMP-forming)/AMP-acid ligase II
VAPSLIHQCYERFPNVVATRLYGCTEAPSITSGARSRADRSHGAETDGMIERTAVRLVRPGTETEVVEGEEGEVLARGAQVMLRYLRDEDNQTAFTSDGWFRTGDLGRVVDGRYLLITGRAKDLIIRKGENLSPKEIEDALHSHPAVAAAAVIGVPDPDKGEAVCAFLVLRPGGTLDMPEVRTLIAQAGLAAQKTPERLEFVDELPMSLQGKVRKDALQAMARLRLEPEAS